MKSAKRVIGFFFFLVLAKGMKGQVIPVEYGSSFKMEVKGYDLRLLGADHKSIFYSELKNKRVSIAVIYRTIPKIIKFNKETLGFEKEMIYEDVLGEADFYDFQFLRGRLFLFAKQGGKRSKEFAVSAVEIDPLTLKPNGPMRDIVRFETAETRKNTEFAVIPNPDSNHFILTATRESDRRRIRTVVVDLDLKVEKEFNLTLPLAVDYFALYTMHYTRNGLLLVAGNEFPDIDPSVKRKKRYLLYPSVTAFDEKGNQVFKVNLSDGASTMLSATMREMEGDKLMISGLTTINIEKSSHDGVGVCWVDLKKGKVISSSYTIFKNTNGFGGNLGGAELEMFLDDNSFYVKSLDITPDQHILLTAESYAEFSGVVDQHYVTEITYHGLIAIKFSFDGKVQWISGVPRNQVMQILGGSDFDSRSFWNRTLSSYGAANGYVFSSALVMAPGRFLIFMNDASSNENVISPEQKVKRISGTKGLATYLLAFDLKTGKITRYKVEEDPANTVPHFSKGMVVGKHFLFPSRQARGSELSKFDITLGRVEIDR